MQSEETRIPKKSEIIENGTTNDGNIRGRIYNNQSIAQVNTQRNNQNESNPNQALTNTQIVNGNINSNVNNNTKVSIVNEETRNNHILSQNYPITLQPLQLPPLSLNPLQLPLPLPLTLPIPFTTTQNIDNVPLYATTPLSLNSQQKQDNTIPLVNPTNVMINLLQNSISQTNQPLRNTVLGQSSFVKSTNNEQKDTEIQTNSSDDVNGNKQWRSNSEGLELGGQTNVELCLKNGYDIIRGTVLCCVPQPPLCIIRRRRENVTEGFDVHILRLDEIEKWRIYSDPKQKQSEDIELKFPSDRPRVLQKNLLLRQEQVARLNLNAPSVIQKCFNRLQRNINGKVEWRENAIVVDEILIIDEKNNYQSARIDSNVKMDQQKMKNIKNIISYIEKILESFWKEESETNQVIPDKTIHNQQINNNSNDHKLSNSA